jgi:hypothetical protein
VIPLKSRARVALDDQADVDREIEIVTRALTRRPCRVPASGHEVRAANVPLVGARPYYSLEYAMEVRRGRAEAIAMMLASVTVAIRKRLERILARCRGGATTRRDA